HGTYTFDLVDSTGSVADYSLYRPEIPGSNYRPVLDSLGLAVRYRSESDAEAMTAEYLIRNIDQAFEARERYPWAGHYSDDLFRRYVLPYRIDVEELTDWRAFFRERYEPMVDTLSEPRTVRRVARLIIRDVNSRFGFHEEALMLKPAFTPQEAFACGRGECNSVADIHVLALRAMGIAATKDMIPVWGTSDGGHAEAVYFDEEGNPVMLDTGEWLAAGPPKIYRVEFAPWVTSTERANVFEDPYYRDVTAEYVATSDLTVAFDSVADATAGERAALAVFGNERWRPAVLAEETESESDAGLQRYVFRQIGRGMLYLPVWVDEPLSVRPAGRPFRLDPRGNIQYHGEPDTTRSVTMDLTPLVRRRDLDTLDAGRLYVAYWTPQGWRRVDAEVCRSVSATDGGPVYTVAGVPADGIYCLFDKTTGRTYHRRIFYFRKGTVRRF
ncbi:MAG: hypothetical protein K2K83_03095, partial [Rikenella sp.]|nr:hypothetical protein [Rikenella sp.]